jgi:superkiller protein 3
MIVCHPGFGVQFINRTMASTKSLLKAAKADLDARKYAACVDKAQEVLKTDAENYFALVAVCLLFAILTIPSLSFLGRASEKLGKVNDAEKAYRAATRVKPDDVTAWTGLSILYEAQGSARVKDYIDASLAIAKIHMALYVTCLEPIA